MDEKEFLAKLSELTEWYRPQTGPNGAASAYKKTPKKVIEHPGPITEEQLAEMSDYEVQQYYDQLVAWRESQPNNSIAPVIKKLKNQIKSCEDCDRILEEPRRVERKLHDTGQKHWRVKCSNCQCYQNPVTKQFDLQGARAHQFLADYYRPKLGKYKSKYQPEVKKPIKTVPKPVLTKNEILEKIVREGYWETKETEHSITRIFVPKLPGDNNDNNK